MAIQRRYVLTAVFLALLVLAGAVLFRVLGTVFFAVTVAYLLTPVHRRLVARGFPSRWASAVATTAGTIATLVPLGVLGYILYRRREDLVALLQGLPESLTFAFAGFSYTVSIAAVLDLLRGLLSTVAVEVARVLPVLALKFMVFALVVFALLVRHREAAHALLGAVPPEYHDAVAALHRRTRETLFAIYVLQAVTAAGTFLLALPVFAALGYPFVVTLAFVAALLQFLPIVGPSVLLVLLAAHEASVGDFAGAVLTLALGFVVIASLPDLLIRPWFARWQADLPGSLYFVGFVGGLLTLGPVGFVAGPLAVALLVEGLDLISALNGPVESADEE